MALLAPTVGAGTRAATAVRPRRLALPSLGIAAATAGFLWVGVATLVGAGRLGATLAGGWVELAGPLFIAVVVVAVICERMWPAQPRPLLARGHVQDACFFFVYVSCVVPVMTLLGVAFASLLGSHAVWIEAPWTASWPLWLVVPLTLVAMDGANWLAHWADHRITALWRFHALHHSQEELNVLTSFRAHPLVHTTGFFLATIPVLSLMGDRPVAPAVITLYVCLGTLPHTNVRWSLGPVGRVLVSPAYHRIHHAIGGPEGANLGIVLTIWDVMAGRAVFARNRTSVAATGLAGRPLAVEQSGERSALGMLAGQLVEPFFAQRGVDAERGSAGQTMTIEKDPPISFRPLRRDDFPILSAWLSSPHVQEWWREEFDAGALEARYGPVVDRTDPTECFVVEHEGSPAGFVQRYLFIDNPEWQSTLAATGAPADGAGIDFLIGAVTLIGVGLGPKMIDQFVDTTWPRYPDVPAIVVNVSFENRRSWRALEKAGFVRFWSGRLESEDPSDEGLNHVYVCRRPGAES